MIAIAAPATTSAAYRQPGPAASAAIAGRKISWPVDDAAEKLQYDLYYVKNHSLILDTLVLFETVRVVLTGEGAH